MSNLFKNSGRLTASLLSTDKENNISGGLSYQAPISNHKNIGVSFSQSTLDHKGLFEAFGFESTLSTLSGFLSSSKTTDKKYSLKTNQQISITLKTSSVSSVEEFSDIFNQNTDYALTNFLYQRHYNIGQKYQHFASLKPTVGYVTVADDTNIPKSFMTINLNYRFLRHNWIDSNADSNTLNLSIAGQ